MRRLPSSIMMGLSRGRCTTSTAASSAMAVVQLDMAPVDMTVPWRSFMYDCTATTPVPPAWYVRSTPRSCGRNADPRTAFVHGVVQAPQPGHAPVRITYM